MSHTTTYANKVTDISLFCNVCEELGYDVKYKNGQAFSVKHYHFNKVDNAVASVKLPGWKYPLAVNNKGEILYDHWGSETWWIDHDGNKIPTMEVLGRTLQHYNERLIIQNVNYAEVEGSWTENLENGDRKIILQY